MQLVCGSKAVPCKCQFFICHCVPIKYTNHLLLVHRSQIRQTLKKKAFEDAGIPVKQMAIIQQTTPPPPAPLTGGTNSISVAQPPATIISAVATPDEPIAMPAPIKVEETIVGSSSVAAAAAEPPSTGDGLLNKSAAGDMMMTLNRLNTQESEVDVEGLSSDVKMEFVQETVVQTSDAITAAATAADEEVAG